MTKKYLLNEWGNETLQPPYKREASLLQKWRHWVRLNNLAKVIPIQEWKPDSSQQHVFFLQFPFCKNGNRLHDLLKVDIVLEFSSCITSPFHVTSGCITSDNSRRMPVTFILFSLSVYNLFTDSVYYLIRIK